MSSSDDFEQSAPFCFTFSRIPLPMLNANAGNNNQRSAEKNNEYFLDDVREKRRMLEEARMSLLLVFSYSNALSKFALASPSEGARCKQIVDVSISFS